MGTRRSGDETRQGRDGVGTSRGYGGGTRRGRDETGRDGVGTRRG